MSGAYRRSPQALWRGSSSRVVLLGPSDPDPFVVTGAGAALWDLLESPVTLGSAATLLASRYDVEEEMVSGTLAPLLDELVERQVVQRIPGQA